ncbi:MAG: DUF4364 family protein [Oscillospiraceae bacterium]|nr:DUF4364 family protein [Oscillospiraceae bacterium]
MTNKKDNIIYKKSSSNSCFNSDVFFDKTSVNLHLRKDIKILICYICDIAGSPVDKNVIVSTIQTCGVANYFDITDVISKLVEDKILELENGKFKVTSQGKAISEGLFNNLPLSIIQKITQKIESFIEISRKKKENKTKIEKTDNGYTVICNISGGNFNLMSMSIFAPELEQAILIRDNFQKNPEKIYKYIIQQLVF